MENNIIRAFQPLAWSLNLGATLMIEEALATFSFNTYWVMDEHAVVKPTRNIPTSLITGKAESSLIL